MINNTDFTSYENTQVVLLSSDSKESRILLQSEYPHYCLSESYIRGFETDEQVIGQLSKLSIDFDKPVSKITLVDFPHFVYHLQINNEVVAASKIIDGEIVFTNFDKSNNALLKCHTNQYGELLTDRIDKLNICIPSSFNYDGILKVRFTVDDYFVDTYVNCIGLVNMSFNHPTEVIVLTFEPYGRKINAVVKINGHLFWNGIINETTNRLILRLVDPCGCFVHNYHEHDSEVCLKTINLSRIDNFSIIFDHRFSDGLKKFKLHQQFITKYSFDGFVAKYKFLH